MTARVTRTFAIWRVEARLAALSEAFGVNALELLDMPLRRDTSELSEEELHLLHLYRRSRAMPQRMRTALRETLESTIKLYLTAASEQKGKGTRKK